MCSMSSVKEFRSDGTVVHLPLPQLLAGKLEYEVEQVGQVIDYDAKKKRYLAKWLGYGHESNIWEPEKNLEHSADLSQRYWEAAKLIDQHKAGGISQDIDARQRDSAQVSVLQDILSSCRKGQLPSRYRSLAYIVLSSICALYAHCSCKANPVKPSIRDQYRYKNITSRCNSAL